MKDKIKEINITFPWQILDHVDTKDHLLELFNYITNLQEENDYYFKKNNELSTLNTLLRSDRDNYKSRNEKAREYIEERKNLNWYADGVFVYELLNILNGDNK